MKKILFTVGLWCLALCVQAVGHISRLRAELQDSRSDYVFVVAHRGDWRHAPENSVAAIKGAADMGWTWWRLTSNGRRTAVSC